MQIIWDQKAIEKIKNSHTVLELETFVVGNENITAYCVVPAEKILNEFTQLDANKELHNVFVTALKEKNYPVCKELYEHLMGKFGGEADTFYDEIIKRIDNIAV